MEISISKLFFEQLEKCPIDFQKDFRKVYQQLKIVDSPTEIKGVEKFTTNKKYFKLTIDKSRISLKLDNEVLSIACFLYNQYFEKVKK
jgi:mRNA-degrading endonuclease RelE of RelBE toxin-antitoxin system